MLSANTILAERKLGELLEAYPFAFTAFEALNLALPSGDSTLAEWLAATPEARFREYGMSRRSFAGQFISMIRKLADNSRMEAPRVETLTIHGGTDKGGRPEKLELTFRPGDTVCLIGPTGAGKSRLLSDIECLADGDTVSRRSVVLEGENCAHAQGSALIAQLSQSMSFVTDLPVCRFLELHGESAGKPDPKELALRVYRAALDLAGEAFDPELSLTQLSGGQARALMIADIALISDAPILLIDEIENAGLDKGQALELLRRQEKLLFISTHDPALALSCGLRLLIRDGAVVSVAEQTDQDRRTAAILAETDRSLQRIRDCLRNGDPLPGLRNPLTLEE